MPRLEKVYLTREERSALPPTYLGMKVREHYNYPVDLPIPPQLPLESIVPEEREAVRLYYTHLHSVYKGDEAPHEFSPIYQAPLDFAAYVDQCCEDLAAGNRNPETDVNYWLYPGVYVADGHVVAVMLFNYPLECVTFPWPHLLALSIRGYPHTHFPPEICQMRQLKLLFAGWNEMATLPPAIGQLSALRVLAIGRTQLTTLPEEICRLSSLIYFSCERAHLKALPATIGDLSSLRYLILRNNELTSLPDSIGNLQSLTRLDLVYNQLSDLPAGLALCRNLRWIILESNRFTAFPAPLATLSCAISFDMNYLRSLYGVPRHRYRDISAELPERVYEWIRNEQYDLITTYYARPLLDIVELLIHDGTLPELETERLLHEATPAIRQYLENHLPATHPIITSLAERWPVEIPNDPEHHQIFL